MFWKQPFLDSLKIDRASIKSACTPIVKLIGHFFENFSELLQLQNETKQSLHAYFKM